MKKLNILAMLISMALAAKAQDSNFLSGFCKDENGNPIENVSVYANDSLLVSVTDEDGGFAVEQVRAEETLRFTHIAYEPECYTVREKDLQGKIVNVRLKIRNNELPEVEITANAPHVAFDNPTNSVIDYAIREDGIYMIVHRLRNTSLLHLSFEMDTLHELKISPRYNMLYKDVYDKIHLISNSKASQVDFVEYNTGRKDKMDLYFSMSIEAFYKKFSPVVAASDSVYVTGSYFYYNKELEYQCHIPYNDKNPYSLCYIIDEEGRDDIWLLLKTGGKVQNNNVGAAAPIYNPIYEIDNKFYLFAFTDHETIVFDAVGKELERHPLTFHEYKNWNGKMKPDRRWKKKILVDEATKTFYTFFVNDGHYVLKRIDLEKGTAEPVFDLSGYPFAQNMRIHDGVLYFLYSTGFDHRKSLYQVRIEY